MEYHSNPLVSIIVPCYNGQHMIGKLFNSIIAQTYRPIELIVINDGSTDASEAIILSYANEMLQKGIQLKYYFQENRGLGGAIDAGLKHITGEFFCWADIDDFYDAASIEHRADFLLQHPEYGVVTSDAYIVYEDAPETPVGRVSKGVSDNENENQFWNLLNANSIFCAGSHMIRTANFLAVNPDRKIYPARRGQNWQLLLPVYYQYKRFFLNEPLYYYVVRRDSMSKDSSIEDKISRCNEHEFIISKILNNMQMTETDRLNALQVTKVNYARRRMNLYAESGDQTSAAKEFRTIRQLKEATITDWLRSFPAMHKIRTRIKETVSLLSGK